MTQEPWIPDNRSRALLWENWRAPEVVDVRFWPWMTPVKTCENT